MLWRILLALCVLVGVAEAQPAPPSWRPPSGCTSGQAIVFNGSIWTCGSAGITNSAGANVIPKSDGTDLVASSWTDDGTTSTTTGAVSVQGNTTLGNSKSVDLTTVNGQFIQEDTSGTRHAVVLARTPTASTSSTWQTARINTAGTFDTTNGAIESTGVFINSTSTRSTGSNTLTNIALIATATGGQANRAFQTNAGDVILNASSGTTTIGGALTANSTATITGLLTATAGVTTPGNLTTTGTGDLVVADDATIGGDLTVSGVINVAPVVQTESGTSLGTVTLGANVNVLMLSGSNPTLDGMTGGVDGRRVTICHTQTSSSALQIVHEDTGETAENRFQNPFSQTMRVRDRSCVDAIYIGDAQRWQLTEDGHFTNASTSSTLGVGSNLTVGGNTTAGNADNDYLESRGTLAVSGTDVSINSCGSGASVSGEAQSFQVTAGEGAATCTIDLNRTFNSAPYCTFSAANQTAAGYIATSTGPGAAPRISSTTTTVTLTFEQAIGAGGGAAPIYNVSCLDRR